jgi:hypothetical protein
MTLHSSQRYLVAQEVICLAAFQQFVLDSLAMLVQFHFVERTCLPVEAFGRPPDKTMLNPVRFAHHARVSYRVVARKSQAPNHSVGLPNCSPMLFGPVPCHFFLNRINASLCTTGAAENTTQEGHVPFRRNVLQLQGTSSLALFRLSPAGNCKALCTLCIEEDSVLYCSSSVL